MLLIESASALDAGERDLFAHAYGSADDIVHPNHATRFADERTPCP